MIWQALQEASGSLSGAGQRHARALAQEHGLAGFERVGGHPLQHDCVIALHLCRVDHAGGRAGLFDPVEVDILLRVAELLHEFPIQELVLPGEGILSIEKKARLVVGQLLHQVVVAL